MSVEQTGPITPGHVAIWTAPGVVQDGVVVNLILWDGQSSWTPPAGCTVIIANGLNIGDTVPAAPAPNT